MMGAASRQARRTQLGAAELTPRWKSLFMPSWGRQLPHKHGVDRTQLISYLFINVLECFANYLLAAPHDAG